MLLHHRFQLLRARKAICLTRAIIVTTILGIAPLMTNAEDSPKSVADTGIPVTTTQAQQTDWAVTIVAQGEVLPWEVAFISAKTTGLGATEINAVDGDTVKKGQILVRFDDRLLRAELNQAQANLALASANVNLAQANLERVAQLKQKKTLSEQDFDLVANQAATAAAARDQAVAALALAQIRLDDATLTAPDDGKILARNINLGQVPQAGEPLFQLLRQHKLEWVAHIDAADLVHVKNQMTAELQIAGEHTISGVVRSVSARLTSGSRLGEVRIILDGTPALAVNTYAAGHILIGNAEAVTAPAESLVIKDGKTWMFRVNQDSVEQVPVSLGRRRQDRIEILSGIHAGDTVVLEGAGFLNHGDKVAIQVVQTAGVM